MNDDTISRQAAILALVHEQSWNMHEDQRTAIGVIADLPPAGEQRDGDIIGRQAAIAYAISGLTRELEGEKWIRVSEVRESLKTMPSAEHQGQWIPVNDDTISRKSAIDALEEPCKVPDTWTDEYAVGERAQWEKDVKALNSLPSAERHGRWVNVKISISGNSSAECSLCGAVVHDDFSNVINYCPNCGAKMDIVKGE